LKSASCSVDGEGNGVTFSGPVSLVGGDVMAIEIGYADDDQWYPADSPVAAGANAIDVGIGSNGFTDWRILTQPAAITQTLAVPMSGTVA
jgi:hypothetical protein